MTLSGDVLKEKIRSGEIVVKPFSESAVQPASIDLKLADEFLYMEGNRGYIELTEPVQYVLYEGREFFLPPKSFVLARTYEYLEVPLEYSAFVEGRSSIGRLGLFIQNAGWIDPGFKGTLTLELFNAADLPIRLVAGRRICQVIFSRLEGELEQGYSGKYLGQQSVTGSRIDQDVELR
jgi:dCTP deaminase